MENPEKLPLRYQKCPYTVTISDALSDVAGELLEEARDLPNQFYVPTATWALPAWEALVGVTPEPGATLEERRGAVLARLMAGGIATPELIESMAQAITGYQAQVSEDIPGYTFTLKFYNDPAGFIRIDADMLRGAVEEVKPAHLVFLIQPITWSDIESAGLTWGQMETTFSSWADLESSFYARSPGGSGGAS